MKVKDLIKDLSFFDNEDDVLAYFYDEESDVEYECDFKVDGDVIPLLNLEEMRRYWAVSFDILKGCDFLWNIVVLGIRMALMLI